MAKFYLIDHSLKKVGSHHYEYALHILSAAERAGYEPILGANRKFTKGKEISPAWRLNTDFRYSTYSEVSVVVNLARWLRRKEDAADAGAELPWWRRSWKQAHAGWGQFSELRRLLRAERRIRSFAKGTRRLLKQFPLAARDQVFLPTMNELDLIGAQRVWAADPTTRQADWHLQFHFNIEPDWEADPQLRAYHLGRIREIFARCRNRFPQHRLFFHTTTEGLAAQYNRLEAVPFRWLPYPVNPAFESAKASRRADAPLRVTCIGGVRVEKGIDVLPTLLRSVWQDTFLTGQAQLAIQAESEHKLPSEVRALWSAQATAGRSSSESPDPLKLIPFPLDSDGYQRLITDSDIGLLLYDRHQYQARCSGVLVELLSAGVPVLVPAGCWLADQIAEEIYRHREIVVAGMQRHGPEVRLDLRRLNGQAGTILQVARPASHLLYSLRWQAREQAQTYCRLQMRQRNSSGRPLETTVEILSPRPDAQTATMLVPLRAEAAQVEIEWRTALTDQPLEVLAAGAQFLATGPEAIAMPRGAVGLLFSDPAQTPDLLRDLVTHYRHYERTAAAFARRFFAEHSPAHVVAMLGSLSAGTTSRAA
ncbi:MAG TPA: hypothetical protein VFE24_07140 [Pirellulales bacterium]|jgi:hypothetical protein|nr:hypothetical protein [Pirellulales bacterium]